MLNAIGLANIGVEAFCQHKLPELQRRGVTVVANIFASSIDDFVAIAKFGRAKRKWLSRFLDLTNGIPSHDRFNAVLAAIKPAEFEACLLSWITALHEVTEGELVAIDGKTMCNAIDEEDRQTHILGAVGHQTRTCHTQKKLPACP